MPTEHVPLFGWIKENIEYIVMVLAAIWATAVWAWRAYMRSHFVSKEEMYAFRQENKHDHERIIDIMIKRQDKE